MTSRRSPAASGFHLGPFFIANPVAGGARDSALRVARFDDGLTGSLMILRR
jgi:hypothetical protein